LPKEYVKPSIREVEFGIQQYPAFKDLLLETDNKSFTAQSYAHYLKKSLKKGVDVEPIIRLLNANGLIVFVDDKRIQIVE